MSFSHNLFRTMSIGMLAFAMASGMSTTASGVAVEPNDIMQCEYRESASTEADALAAAGRRGVNAAIGRLLCSEYGLQARELLAPYVGENWEKFVTSKLVLDKRVDRDGIGVFARILIVPEKLMRDLREKKFLYKPAAVPPMMLFVYQSIDGTKVDASDARKIAEKGMLAAGGRVVEPKVPGLSQDDFALRDTGVAAQALETASRAGAEVVVTAIMETTKVGASEVLFDNITTYETRVSMVAFRKDDGAVTGKAEFVERASDKSAEVASAKSIELALANCSASVAADTIAEWKYNFGNAADYQLLVTYVNREQTAQFQRHIEGELGRGTRAYLKCWYGDVAVFCVKSPCGYDDVEKAILNCKIGDMRITDRNGKRITVEPRY